MGLRNVPAAIRKNPKIKPAVWSEPQKPRPPKRAGFASPFAGKLAVRWGRSK